MVFALLQSFEGRLDITCHFLIFFLIALCYPATNWRSVRVPASYPVVAEIGTTTQDPELDKMDVYLVKLFTS